jgi:hypothetical protein
MTRRQRILATVQSQRPDRLPFFHFWRHCQVGWAERECRNRGMGMNWVRPPYVEKLHDVEVCEERVVASGRSVIRRTYSTPVGSVYEDEYREPGVGQWHANRSWTGNSPWITDRLIKTLDDYKVVKYIVEHTEYCADYFPIQQAMEWLGEEGVVLAGLPHSPMQTLMVNWVGSEQGRFFYHFADDPAVVEDLCRAISKSREPMVEIAAKSPAPIAACGDNLDAVLVTPKHFQKYFMPEYEKQAAVLHAHGKFMSVHMDGRLSALKQLIARTPVDIIEALHPPPMGDVPVAEALSVWKDKTLWLGFPGSIYALGPDATRQFALGLLREIGSTDRLAIAMSTENQVSGENLLALTAVLENAQLPLSPEIIDRIERSGK